MATDIAPIATGSTAIEWAEATLNPWTGCTKVSPGCAHCYIDRTLPRLRGAGQGKFVRGSIPLRWHLHRLDQPLRRRKPTIYFVNSLSDVFHEDVPNGLIASLFAMMAKAEQHTFQVLTKRPERMAELLNSPDFWTSVRIRCVSEGAVRVGRPNADVATPLPNVWLGVTVENRRFVHRADLLRATPAAVRFISAEPLLGPLVPDADYMVDADGDTYPVGDADFRAWRPWADGYRKVGLSLENIDWLIAGGESGRTARPVDADWIRDLRDACQDEGTAFLFKQWGGLRPKAGGRELDGVTHNAMPEGATTK